MTYEYVKKTYGFDAVIGGRVQHTVTKRYGNIGRVQQGMGHYVWVKFDGMGHSRPCHADELMRVDGLAGRQNEGEIDP